MLSLGYIGTLEHYSRAAALSEAAVDTHEEHAPKKAAAGPEVRACGRTSLHECALSVGADRPLPAAASSAAGSRVDLAWFSSGWLHQQYKAARTSRHAALGLRLSCLSAPRLGPPPAVICTTSRTQLAHVHRGARAPLLPHLH